MWGRSASWREASLESDLDGNRRALPATFSAMWLKNVLLGGPAHILKTSTCVRLGEVSSVTWPLTARSRKTLRVSAFGAGEEADVVAAIWAPGGTWAINFPHVLLRAPLGTLPFEPPRAPGDVPERRACGPCASGGMAGALLRRVRVATPDGENWRASAWWRPACPSIRSTTPATLLSGTAAMGLNGVKSCAALDGYA